MNQPKKTITLTIVPRVHYFILLGLLGVTLCLAQEIEQQMSELPNLKKVGQLTQLHVQGKPFLALGGELGNSNASDLAYLEKSLERCRQMHLNTIMLPVYWDLIEPTEGKFDFTLVKGTIDLARQKNLKLVYLWFGTWKNSMSCYAPSWVKRDTKRFERSIRKDGSTDEVITPSSAAACDADSKAFGELMNWTREYDLKQQTVIMVQVENEIGFLVNPRDYNEESLKAYQGAVPEKLLLLALEGKLGAEVQEIWDKNGRKHKGTWPEVFGKSLHADEIFSSWQFATYVEKVAAAGKKQYLLPMFTNAALIRPGYQPNQYPAAGPLPHVLEVWLATAPSISMLSPDIYFPNFMEWCEKYVRSGNPLFIPEAAPSMRVSGNTVYAIAHFGAIGVGPFSIENVNPEKERLITSCNKMLAGMSEVVLEAQRKGAIEGLSPQIGFDWKIDDKPQRCEMAGIRFDAKFDRPAVGGDMQTTTLPTLGSGRWDAPPGTPLGSVMIIQLSDEEFVIAGMGVTLTFSPVDGTGRIGLDSVQEGTYESGKWVGGRYLNGDETHQGRHVHLRDGLWSVQRVKLYRY